MNESGKVPRFATIDIDRASGSLAGMIADWYGNAPLPNARISADIVAQRLARFQMQPPAGETIRATQDGGMEAASETGQSPVDAASPGTSVLTLASEALSESIAALKACVEAMHGDHPGDDSYWQAVDLAEAVITKADFRQVCPDAEAAGEPGSREHAQAIVRDARAVLDRLVLHSPDHGVDEFLDAISDARLLVAKIDGAE